MEKNSSRKTQKIANPQKYTPAKISCHTVYRAQWPVSHQVPAAVFNKILGPVNLKEYIYIFVYTKTVDSVFRAL